MRYATTRCRIVGALLCSAWLAVGASGAGAAGWSVGEQSAVAGGTGGAGTARDSDPGAAWYNPAALANGRGLQLAAGLLLAAPSIDATDRGGAWNARTDGGLKTPPHLHATFATGRFAAGLSANVPFGSGVSWPDSWPGRFEAVRSSVTVWRVAPFVAWRLGPLRVAAGPHVDVALLRIQRQLDFVDTEGNVDIDLSGVGVGGHAALFAELLGGRLHLGLTYKSRTRVSLDGVARFEVPDAFTPKATDGSAATTLSFPDLLLFGVGVEIAPRYRLVAALDVGVAFWSVLDRFTIDFEREQTTDAEIVPGWKTRPFVRGGVELTPLRGRLAGVGDRLWLRAGVLYDPSPAPAETLSPRSPDSHRLGGTVGLGYEIAGGLAADVFYAYVRLLGQDSTSAEALPAGYEGHIHLFGLGLRFTAGGHGEVTQR